MSRILQSMYMYAHVVTCWNGQLTFRIIWEWFRTFEVMETRWTSYKRVDSMYVIDRADKQGYIPTT